jgi:hypothetical protein
VRHGLLLLALLAAIACIHRDAAIVVNSRPEGAGIWLDGDSTDFVSPHTFTGVYAGLHALKVVLAGCYWEDTFTLSPKETRTFDKELADRIWTAENSAGVNTSSAIAPDGTIYVTTSSGKLLGYDRSGVQKSNHSLPFSDAKELAVGDDGRIYVKSDATLLVLSPQGESLWSCATLPGGGIAPGRNGVVYISAGSGLSACDSQGIVLWSRRLASSWEASPPIVGTNGAVYVMVSESLFAVDSAGTIGWACDMNFHGYAGGSLALGPDGTVYFTDRNRLYAVAPDGNLCWALTLGEYYYAPTGPSVGTDGTIYLSSRDTVYAVNPDGTRRWCSSCGGHSARLVPVIADDGRLYVVGSHPWIAAFEADGRTLWRVGDYGNTSFHPVLTDSILLVVDSDRMLAAYRVSGTGPAQGWPMFQHDSRRSGRAR